MRLRRGLSPPSGWSAWPASLTGRHCRDRRRAVHRGDDHHRRPGRPPGHPGPGTPPWPRPPAGWQRPRFATSAPLGGNLNQRPRLLVLPAHPLIPCLKKGAATAATPWPATPSTCAFTGGDRCYIVHPSDTAVALSVMEATIEVAGGGRQSYLAHRRLFCRPRR